MSDKSTELAVHPFAHSWPVSAAHAHHLDEQAEKRRQLEAAFVSLRAEGAVAERERIRLELLKTAERLFQARHVADPNDEAALGAAAEALRDFAHRLEGE